MARHRSGSSSPGTTADQPPPGAVRGRHRHDPATTPLDLAAIARATATARGSLDSPLAPRTGETAVVGPAPAAAPRSASTPAAPRSASAPAAPRSASTPTGARRSDARPAAPRTGEQALPVGGPTGPAAPAGRSSHRRAPARRIPVPTRAAGAIALVGALAGAGVAASGGGTPVAEPAADTGEFLRPAPVADAAAVPIAPAARAATPTRAATTTPKPKPAAPKAPTAVAAPDDGGKTLWSADFAKAGTGNFKSTPWNFVGASTPKVAGGLLNLSMPGGGKRAELEPEFKNLSEGDEYWFGFSVKLADDFPVNSSDWQIITQWKNEGTGSPPLEVKVQDGKFLLDGDSGGFSKVIGDARPGQWTHLALKVKFSSSDGTVTAYQDGVQRFADYAPSSGTLYSGKSSYVKTGLYRDTSIGQAGKLSFGSWAIGTSLGSVSKGVPGAPARD
jgi:hypothetical protein